MSSPAAGADRSGGPVHDTDVVVVGAGPVGLALACALAHHGVSYRVIEERTAPRKTSRANNVWARPQELLESIGVREAIAADAYDVSTINVLLDGKPLDQVSLDPGSSPHGSALYTSQAVIEATLTGVLTDRGGRVEGGRVVRSLTQDADGVDVVVGPADGEGSDAQEVVRCRYVIGADGGHSTVRESLGIDLLTETIAGRSTRQIDAKLAWRRPTDPDQIWFFTYHHGFAGVLPVSGGYHRMFFLEEERIVPDRDPTLEEMQQRAREITGDPTVTLTDPVWFSHGTFKHGVAREYGSGRVFLAGDAGHRNLPIGGQGMNAGIHDAVGIAWRLAMTLAGQAGTRVLDTYATERHGEHVRLDGDQARGFQRLMFRNRLGDAALGAAADWVPNLGSRIFGADDLQQLSVAYRDSALSADRFSAVSPVHRRDPRAGDRAPDARVTTTGGVTTTLFEHLYNPDGHTWGWTLLGFDGRRQDSRGQLSDALDAAASRAWVHPRLVLADPSEAEDDGGRAVPLFDLDGNAHAAYGFEGRPALVLVRPDGHIAFRGAADEGEALEAYCAAVGGIS